MKQVILTQQLLTRTEVQQAVRLSCSAIYRLMRVGKFPTPIRVGENAVRWKVDEINGYLDSRPRAEGETGQVNVRAIAETEDAQFASA